VLELREAEIHRRAASGAGKERGAEGLERRD